MTLARAQRFVVLAVVALSVAGCDGEGDGDAGTQDAAAPVDGGGRDGGGRDGGGRDGGRDAGNLDASATDAAGLDAGADAGPVDAQVDLPDVSVADASLPACGVGELYCDGACRPAEDSEHCGACGRTCYGERVLGATCAAATCAIVSCTLGYADVNRVAEDGCEAAQDFTLALESASLVLRPGTSTSVAVDVVRVNGFPSPLSATLLDLPPALSVSPSAPSTVDARLFIGLSAGAGATPALINARVRVAASGGSTLVRELPLIIEVVNTAVDVTSVEVLRGGVVLLGNEAPQSSGTLTLRVRGTGLLPLAAAGIDGLLVTPVAGGTDTEREFTTEIPSGFDVGSGRRPLALDLRTSSGRVATLFGALVATGIAVSPSGNDIAIGSSASPVQSLERAFALAGAGDMVLLKDGTHVPSATAAPAGLAEIRAASRHAATIQCASGATTGLRLATSLEVNGVVLRGCTVGVDVADGSGTLTLDHAIVDDCDAPFEVTSAARVELLDTEVTASGPVVFTSGYGVVGDGSVVLSGVRGEGASVLIRDSRVASTTSDAVVIAAAFEASRIEDSEIGDAPGAALSALPGAVVETERTTLSGSGRGVVVNAATLRATFTYIHNHTGAGVVMSGPSPSVTFVGPLASAVFGNGAEGILVTPASGTAVLAIGALAVEANRGGIDVQNPAGVTTNLTIDGLGLTRNALFGLRVQGGTTNVAANSLLEIDVPASNTAPVVQLLSGDGTIELSRGTWRVRGGTGLALLGAARHAVRIGTAARTVTIDVTGHVYDGTFGVVDNRSPSPSLAPMRVRAQFLGSDGAARTWSGTFTGTTGSYSMGVSPRDIASWFVTSSGSLDFGAP